MSRTEKGHEAHMCGENVVVLGGSGFIGRQVTALLSDRGMTVTVVSRRRQTQVVENVHFLSLDLESALPRELQLLFENASTVVNATGSIWGRPAASMETGVVRPTKVVLSALGDMESKPRYIHLGSVLEDVPNGNSQYGRAKAAAANLFFSAQESSGLNGCILRIANAIGPGAPHSSLLGRAAAQLSESRSSGHRALTLGALDASRDFVDVRDVAESVVRALTGDSTGVIPIGSGRSTPVRRLVEELIQVSGFPAHIDCSGEAMGHSTGSIPGVDLTAARTKLDWIPKRSLASSIHDYWTEYQEKR